MRLMEFCANAALLIGLVAMLDPMPDAKAAEAERVFPSARWELRDPESLGLSKAKLNALRELVGGRGCVVRYGYMTYSWGDTSRSADIASGVKPLISTLLFFAIQEGRLTSADAPVVDFEPRLRTLNSGK